MPVADILASRVVRLTPQQIADFMLSEDKAWREAVRRGDLQAAMAHEAESCRLMTILQDNY